MRGKPTSKSRVTGRCRAGKTRCRSCRDHPVEKSRSKRMGRYKRLAVDVHNNPSLAEFYLQPSLKKLHISSLRDITGHEIDEQFCYTDVRIYVATVNGVIDAAFSRMHEGLGLNREMEETMAMAFELASGTIGTGDGADLIPAIEEAFHREFGIYENAVEGSDFSETHFARRWGSVLSEESWSDVELSESSSHEDDWTMVEDGHV